MLNKRFSAILFGATIVMTTFTVKAPSAQAKPWRVIGKQIQRSISKPKVPTRKIPTGVSGVVQKAQPYINIGVGAAGFANHGSSAYCRFNPCKGNDTNTKNQNQPRRKYIPGEYYRY
jgi:hypothetical protein